mmetsp:Transcript_3545/g.328  ORF Transcript_3545/g.328 Transcript_3545/m.328 type:complete len:112 (+) Transcript_3545:355-690(+)
MNSISTKAKESSSLKSNKSNKNLILSSNLVLENNVIPLNNSNESIRPLLSVSHMTKALSLRPKICSNSLRSMEKLSQILLNDAWKSLTLDNGTFNKEFVFFLNVLSLIFYT